MTTTQIIATAVVVIAAAALLVFYLKTHTLEQIRGDVYQLFLKVEHKYLQSGAGKEKLNEVVDLTYNMLPPWARVFFTRKILQKIIDEWFSKVKDLLDDGKANNSHGS